MMCMWRRKFSKIVEGGAESRVKAMHPEPSVEEKLTTTYYRMLGGVSAGGLYSGE
jgi:hypothetical protein